jgi:hypothetical protein
VTSLSSKLTQRCSGAQLHPAEITGEDVQRLRLTPDLVADVVECLESPEIDDKEVGLYFSQFLIAPGKLNREREAWFIAYISDLSQGATGRLEAPCFRLMRRFRFKMRNYRDLMLKALESADPLVRKEALLAYEAYRLSGEVAPLEKFERDDHLAGSGRRRPKTFELRNLALEEIERVMRATFKKVEKTEVTPEGDKAVYRDWAPYYRWKKSPWRRFLNRLFKPDRGRRQGG